MLAPVRASIFFAFAASLVVGSSLGGCGSVPDISFPQPDAAFDARAPDATVVEAGEDVATDDSPTCIALHELCTRSQDCCSGNCVSDRGTKTCN
jgi:hypothetical protein